MANIKAQATDRDIFIYSTREGSDGDPIDSHQSVVEAVETSVGLPNSVVASTNTGSFSLISLFKRFLNLFSTVDTNVADLNTKLPTLGVKTTAQSLSVTLASNHSTLPVSISSIPLALDSATATNQTTTNNSLSSINSKLPTLGTKTAAQSLPVTLASDQSAIAVLISSIPLASDAATATNQINTNSSLSSINNKLPALGVKTSENSLPVVIASNQPSRTVSMSAINLNAVSGDQTILTPTSGKSLQIFNIVLNNSTTATSFILKQGTTSQGQTNLTGTVTAFDYAGDFAEPLGLAVNRSFVINLPRSGTLSGYVTWREE